MVRAHRTKVSSGGHDLGASEVLGRKISEAYAAGAVLGSVCHGARIEQT